MWDFIIVGAVFVIGGVFIGHWCTNAIENRPKKQEYDREAIDELKNVIKELEKMTPPVKEGK
jgi:hypothetical protein|nr:MAG TPA: oxidoreductase [Caudoviricetes sp.]